MFSQNNEGTSILLHITDIQGNYLWFEASPYKGIGYKKGLADGGHKTTESK